MSTLTRVAVGLFVSLALAGCSRSGSGTVALSGKVRCGGKPVPPGTLYFVNGSTIVGKVRYGADGAYFVLNLPPGELGVALSFQQAALTSAGKDAGRTAAMKQLMAKPPSLGSRLVAAAAQQKHSDKTALAKKLAAAQGNVANPAYRITVAAAPIEQKIDIDFPTP
jgi:hypothetical protein